MVCKPNFITIISPKTNYILDLAPGCKNGTPSEDQTHNSSVTNL